MVLGAVVGPFVLFCLAAALIATRTVAIGPCTLMVYRSNFFVRKVRLEWAMVPVCWVTWAAVRCNRSDDLRDAGIGARRTARAGVFF